jgi:hypothetical protein
VCVYYIHVGPMLVQNATKVTQIPGLPHISRSRNHSTTVTAYSYRTCQISSHLHPIFLAKSSHFNLCTTGTCGIGVSLIQGLNFNFKYHSPRPFYSLKTQYMHPQQFETHNASQFETILYRFILKNRLYSWTYHCFNWLLVTRVNRSTCFSCITLARGTISESLHSCVDTLLHLNSSRVHSSCLCACMHAYRYVHGTWCYTCQM